MFVLQLLWKHMMRLASKNRNGNGKWKFAANEWSRAIQEKSGWKKYYMKKLWEN